MNDNDESAPDVNNNNDDDQYDNENPQEAAAAKKKWEAEKAAYAKKGKAAAPVKTNLRWMTR